MKEERLFDRRLHRDGLVIVFPPGVTGLFNPRVHRLVSEVGEQLDGVYVTYALSGGTGPDVEAATRAAEFAGCDSAVVVYSADIFPENASFDSSTDTLWPEDSNQAGLRETAQWVVTAYNHVRAATGIAA